jgi:hypothetical protein
MKDENTIFFYYSLMNVNSILAAVILKTGDYCSQDFNTVYSFNTDIITL